VPEVTAPVTSDLQIEANRRNARLSTGPRTPQGKAAIRFNALKHGLTAQHITLFDECAEDFEAFHAELVAALRPKGALEQALAERAVLCAWRLRRVYRFETGLFRKARGTWSNGTAETTSDVAVVFLRLASNEDDLAKLSRYETTLERSLQRALRALERRQLLRGEGAFAPVGDLNDVSRMSASPAIPLGSAAASPAECVKREPGGETRARHSVRKTVPGPRVASDRYRG
jgi:hypothetical protein